MLVQASCMGAMAASASSSKLPLQRVLLGKLQSAHSPLQSTPARGHRSLFSSLHVVATAAAAFTSTQRRKTQPWQGSIARCSQRTAATGAGARTGRWEPLTGGALCRERFVEVPLDHWKHDKELHEQAKISVFVREVVLAEKQDELGELPALLFLQGGPGFPSARPTSAASGWLSRALQEYRVLLLDQRGTGRSAPITAQTLVNLDPEEQASYLSKFRADSIVQDCELIRKSMGLQKISLLGQSFGGFCSLTYLSFFPESLQSVFITGGIAPALQMGADTVYRATYRRVIERNRRYYQRYPGDAQKIRDIVTHLVELGEKGVALPGGGRLTARRFMSLGLMLGAGDGIETLHWLVEDAFVEVLGSKGDLQLDMRFLHQVEASQSFDTNPIYWMLHEAIYCDGPRSGASRWAAARVLNEPEFCDAFDFHANLAIPDKPLFFTGEMVFPWFADDFGRLAHFREAAEILATKTDWSYLYDHDRLRNTSVPVAAAVYYDDMYVEREFSEEVATLLGPNCRMWVTNEFQHSGVRDDGSRILDTLIKMSRGVVQIPS